MTEVRTERRLTTILAADVVGYSHLMSADEAGTLASLKALRAEVIDPKCAEFRGRVVKLMGDGTLMEFGSVVDAVSFAVDVQRAMAERNAEISEDRRIAYRIGINIGDIIVEGDDIYGDGVNIAARLEALAEPGGICVARNVYSQVETKVDVAFEDLGMRQVKNIPKPVQVFKVLLDRPAGQGAARVTDAPRRLPTLRLLAGGLAALIVVAGLALWQRPWVPREEAASVENMAFPLPDKPSVAVLPFANMSDDPAQAYFADGMTEDLITDLSKISGLFVIARNSSFAYKGQQVKVRQVAEDLGVRYVLEGSVRRIGEDVRINTKLIDATTGGHVWAERYDRTFDNIFAVQDEIMARVVEALELRLTESEQDQRPKTTSLEAYDLVLQARRLMNRFDRKAAAEAGDLLRRAVEIDPGYVEANSLLGLHYFDQWRIWGRKRDKNLASALEFAKKAVALSPSDPAPHVLLALIYQWRREFDKANTAADTALALQPNDAIALSSLASMLNWAGRSEEALDAIQQAIRLDPFHPPNYLQWLASAYDGVGDYEGCVEAANRGIALDPDYVGLYVDLAICYAILGMEEEAQAAAAEIARTNPRFNLKAYATYAPNTNKEELQRNVDLLRASGVPESADAIFRVPEGHMTGDQIRAAISGQAFRDTYPVRFAGTINTFHTSGKLSGYPEDGSPAEQFGSDQGEWWIEGDKFCRKWMRWVSGRRGCFSFVQDGDSIRWINRYGELLSVMKRTN